MVRRGHGENSRPARISAQRGICDVPDARRGHAGHPRHGDSERGTVYSRRHGHGACRVGVPGKAGKRAACVFGAGGSVHCRRPPDDQKAHGAGVYRLPRSGRAGAEGGRARRRGNPRPRCPGKQFPLFQGQRDCKVSRRDVPAACGDHDPVLRRDNCRHDAQRSEACRKAAAPVLPGDETLFSGRTPDGDRLP